MCSLHSIISLKSIKTKEAVTDIHNEDQMALNVDTQESETQERGDEENPVVRQNTTCNNTTDEMMMPSFPVLSTPERPHKKSKANVFAILPHLPKRPLFTLIPPYDCEDEGRHNSNIDCITNNQVEDDEENQQTKLEECPHTPRAAVHVHASQLEDLEDDIQSDSCPICLDMYGKLGKGISVYLFQFYYVRFFLRLFCRHIVKKMREISLYNLNIARTCFIENGKLF